MKEKVDVILRLMDIMNVTIDDLKIFDNSIEATKKFPLEVYFSDKTRSFDVEHMHNDGQRFPIGVIIDNIVYVSPHYAGHHCLGNSAEDYCQKALPYGLIGTLPTVEQLKTLEDNLIAYEKISVFLGWGRLKDYVPLYLSIAHSENFPGWQYFYDMERGTVSAHNSITPVLPVIIL